MENVWGHVNLYAVGAGQAVAQLDVTYGVDYEPFKVAKLSCVYLNSKCTCS